LVYPEEYALSFRSSRKGEELYGGFIIGEKIVIGKWPKDIQYP
jgi:hypothetical protein